MDRFYSPASYNYSSKSYGEPSYSPRSRRSPKGVLSYLTHEKTSNLRITLGTLAGIILALAAFFTWILNKQFTEQELQTNYKWLSGSVMFTKRNRWIVVILWILFLLTVVPFGVGVWFRKTAKKLF